MAIIKIRDKDGNIIPVPALQGPPYELTEEDKVELTGNPVRSAIEQSDKVTSCSAFNFSAEKPVLLVLGGSGGAKAINDIMLLNVEHLHEDGIQIIWQCGEKYYDGLREEMDQTGYPNLRLRAYLHDMPAAYGAADLVVTRAGAGTCSELMNIGKPAMLIPSPNVAGDHQTKNAESLSRIGAAHLMKEDQLNADFFRVVTQLIKDEAQLLSMSEKMKSMAKPHAATKIATRISNYITQTA